MALLADIKSHLKQSMLNKDVAVRDTLRMLLSEIQRFEIDNRVEVDDVQILQIINKMVKQRKDSIEQFTKGDRPDLAAVEQTELEILSKYKPKQLLAICNTRIRNFNFNCINYYCRRFVFIFLR